MIIYGLKAFFSEQKGNIREIRPIWALEELGCSYELVLLDPKAKEHKSAEFLKLNPFGKIPVLKDGEFTLFESSAICTYIGDKNGRLVPERRTKQRALYDQWISAIISNLEPHAGRIFACDFFFEKNEATSSMRKLAEGMATAFLPVFEHHLQKNGFMLEDGFSMADIAMVGALTLLKHTEMLGSFPTLNSYFENMTKRQAYQKALALNAPLV